MQSGRRSQTPAHLNSIDKGARKSSSDGYRRLGHHARPVVAPRVLSEGKAAERKCADSAKGDEFEFHLLGTI